MRTRRLASVWTATLAASTIVLTLVTVVTIPVDAAIDAGVNEDRAHLYSGFADDEHGVDRTWAWIDGTRAEILIPRRSTSDATIVIVCQPNLPTRDTVQQVSASLNGIIIGTVTVKEGWQRVEFKAPGRAWQIGVNELTLFLSSAVSPQESGLSADTRRLSLAVDRLNVRTP